LKQTHLHPYSQTTSAGSYSIITDPPVSSYDEEGKEVWKRELDVYGREKLELTEYKQVKNSQEKQILFYVKRYTTELTIKT